MREENLRNACTKKHETVSNVNSKMLLYHGVFPASQKLWNVKMKVLTLISWVLNTRFIKNGFPKISRQRFTRIVKPVSKRKYIIGKKAKDFFFNTRNGYVTYGRQKNINNYQKTPAEKLFNISNINKNCEFCWDFYFALQIMEKQKKKKLFRKQA